MALLPAGPQTSRARRLLLATGLVILLLVLVDLLFTSGQRKSHQEVYSDLQKGEWLDRWHSSNARPENLTGDKAASAGSGVHVEEVEKEDEHVTKSDSTSSTTYEAPQHEKTTAPASENAQGVDPIFISKPAGSKAIIASSMKRTKHQVDWIGQMLPEWDSYIYTVDDREAKYKVPVNKGREASVYLTFLVDHYDSLPETMVFIHGERYSWHADDPMYDTLPAIANLSLSRVAEVGYQALRCTAWPGCPAHFKPKINHFDNAAKYHSIAGLYASTWKVFFPSEPVPEKVGAPCCSTFAVTREQVLQRSKADYQKYRRWLYQSPENTMRVGEVMEYMWHVIFGKPAMFCEEPTKECFCKAFNDCDLDCPNSQECKGKYWRVPWQMHGLQGWPSKGQGVNGLPFEGWQNNETLREATVYGEVSPDAEISMDDAGAPPDTGPGRGVDSLEG